MATLAPKVLWVSLKYPQIQIISTQYHTYIYYILMIDDDFVFLQAQHVVNVFILNTFSWNSYISGKKTTNSK